MFSKKKLKNCLLFVVSVYLYTFSIPVTGMPQAGLSNDPSDTQNASRNTINIEKIDIVDGKHYRITWRSKPGTKFYCVIRHGVKGSSLISSLIQESKTVVEDGYTDVESNSDIEKIIPKSDESKSIIDKDSIFYNVLGVNNFEELKDYIQDADFGACTTDAITYPSLRRRLAIQIDLSNYTKEKAEPGVASYKELRDKHRYIVWKIDKNQIDPNSDEAITPANAYPSTVSEVNVAGIERDGNKVFFIPPDNGFNIDAGDRVYVGVYLDKKPVINDGVSILCIQQKKYIEWPQTSKQFDAYSLTDVAQANNAQIGVKPNPPAVPLGTPLADVNQDIRKAWRGTFDCGSISSGIYMTKFANGYWNIHGLISEYARDIDARTTFRFGSERLIDKSPVKVTVLDKDKGLRGYIENKTEMTQEQNNTSGLVTSAPVIGVRGILANRSRAIKLSHDFSLQTRYQFRPIYRWLAPYLNGRLGLDIKDVPIKGFKLSSYVEGWAFLEDRQRFHRNLRGYNPGRYEYRTGVKLLIPTKKNQEIDGAGKWFSIGYENGPIPSKDFLVSDKHVFTFGIVSN